MQSPQWQAAMAAFFAIQALTLYFRMNEERLQALEKGGLVARDDLATIGDLDRVESRALSLYLSSRPDAGDEVPEDGPEA
jgi:hypothetical protein